MPGQRDISLAQVLFYSWEGEYPKVCVNLQTDVR